MPALILTLLLIPVFWVLIVRPQQKRQRQHLAMVGALEAGDRVEAYSGIHGTLVEVADTTVRIEVAPGVVLTMARLAVASVLDAEPDQPSEATSTNQSPVRDAPGEMKEDGAQ